MIIIFMVLVTMGASVIITGLSLEKPACDRQLLPTKFAEKPPVTGIFSVYHPKMRPVNRFKCRLCPKKTLFVVLADGGEMVLGMNRGAQLSSNGTAVNGE
jgi:hypothetical protein